MMLTDILLIVRPGHDSRGVAALAAKLAARHGARVEGVCLAPLPELAPEDCFVMGRDAINAVVDRMDRETERLADCAVGRVRDAMDLAGCAFEWTVADAGEPPAQTALRARLADLVVLVRPNPRQGVALALAETLVRHGAAPCLLIPEAWDPDRPLDHAVLAWCARNAADLLVMGAFGRTPHGERWSHGATWTVLTEAQLPVLMSC